MDFSRIEKLITVEHKKDTVIKWLWLLWFLFALTINLIQSINHMMINSIIVICLFAIDFISGWVMNKLEKEELHRLDQERFYDELKAQGVVNDEGKLTNNKISMLTLLKDVLELDFINSEEDLKADGIDDKIMEAMDKNKYVGVSKDGRSLIMYFYGKEKLVLIRIGKLGLKHKIDLHLITYGCTEEECKHRVEVDKSMYLLNDIDGNIQATKKAHDALDKFITLENIIMELATAPDAKVATTVKDKREETVKDTKEEETVKDTKEEETVKDTKEEEAVDDKEEEETVKDKKEEENAE